MRMHTTDARDVVERYYASFDKHGNDWQGLVTDDVEQAKMEAGEFIDLTKAGKLDWNRVKPLHEIMAASVAQPDGGITLFKSLGVGLEDAAVASVIYDRAMASGRFPPL